MFAAALLALPLSAQQEPTPAAPAPSVSAISQQQQPPSYACSDAELEARLAELKQKAEAGDYEATRELYTAYAVNEHQAQAQAWAARYEEQLTAKAESGDAQAMLQLASGYLQGRDYLPVDITKAVSWFVRSAEAGNPSAAFILGEINKQMGNTTDADVFYAQAYQLYKQQLEGANPQEMTDIQKNALYWIGYMELTGCGTEKNAQSGVEKLKQADTPWAWSQLYRCYVKGEGVEQNLSRGIEYARKLADTTEDGLMAWVVASAYLNGEGVQKDKATGMHYLEIAANANIAEAIYHKATLLLAENKAKDAYRYFDQAASMGFAPAITAKARLLLYGAEGVEKDDSQALQMLAYASDRHNDPRAPYELALYYDSVGEPALADDWYKIASDRGVVEAMARRGMMHLTNAGVSWSPTQMYRWWKMGSDAGDETCSLYMNLFLYVFIPLLLIIVFGVPILVVSILNRKAMKKYENEKAEEKSEVKAEDKAEDKADAPSGKQDTAPDADDK